MKFSIQIQIAHSPGMSGGRKGRNVTSRTVELEQTVDDPSQFNRSWSRLLSLLADEGMSISRTLDFEKEESECAQPKKVRRVPKVPTTK